MLCLTRKPGESLVIGEGENRVELTVWSVRGHRVTLRIDAPREMRVMRGELLAETTNEEVRDGD